MKRAIITVRTDLFENWKDVRLWDCCQKVQREYAADCKADYITLTGMDVKIPVDITKLQHIAYYLIPLALTYIKKYDHVCYMDADVLVTPWAPNIFEFYPELDTYRALACKGVCQLATIPYQVKYGITNWIKDKHGNRYFNTGVQLFGNKCKLDFDFNDYIYDAGGHDEPFITSIVMRNGVKNESLMNLFNYMDYDNTLQTRYNAYFIHYGGGGFSGIHNKSNLAEKERIKTEICLSDYNLLYGKK